MSTQKQWPAVDAAGCVLYTGIVELTTKNFPEFFNVTLKFYGIIFMAQCSPLHERVSQAHPTKNQNQIFIILA